jgi:hypothetical protein
MDTDTTNEMTDNTDVSSAVKPDVSPPPTDGNAVQMPNENKLNELYNNNNPINKLAEEIKKINQSIAENVEKIKDVETTQTTQTTRTNDLSIQINIINDKITAIETRITECCEQKLFPTISAIKASVPNDNRKASVPNDNRKARDNNDNNSPSKRFKPTETGSDTSEKNATFGSKRRRIDERNTERIDENKIIFGGKRKTRRQRRRRKTYKKSQNKKRKSRRNKHRTNRRK